MISDDCTLDTFLYSSNSTIVPLFEKVLSASDAGRIGRLVLPKACAEVSFPIFGCATISCIPFILITVT